MRTSKRKMLFYSFYDHTGIEEELEREAAKGWMLEKITAFGWLYRRSEPKRVKFTVCYYPRASAYDPGPSEEQKTFQDFCEHEGWEFVASSAQMQIFRNERENPVPIETDPLLEVETIHRAAKKAWMPPHFILLAIGILQAALLCGQIIRDPLQIFWNTSWLYSLFAWSLLLLICSVELCSYFLWRAKAKKAAGRGEFLETRSHAAFQRAVAILCAAAFVLWIVSAFANPNPIIIITTLGMTVYFVLQILLVNALTRFMKKKNVTASVNRAVSLIFAFAFGFAAVGLITWGAFRLSRNGCFEEWNLSGPPLVIEDLYEVNSEDFQRSYHSSATPFLTKHDLWQIGRIDSGKVTNLPSLHYTLFEVRLPSLYGLCRDSLLQEAREDEFYEPVDSLPWGANEAYRLVRRNSGPQEVYLLCYKARVAAVSFDWEPTDAQMALVAEKLA